MHLRHRRQRRPHHPFASVLLLFALLVVHIPVTAAQPPLPTPQGQTGDCVAATEPNDDIASAVELGTGVACATSDNQQAGQDIYRWSAPDSDTPQTWTFSLTAVPSQVGVLEVYQVDID